MADAPPDDGLTDLQRFLVERYGEGYQSPAVTNFHADPYGEQLATSGRGPTTEDILRSMAAANPPQRRSLPFLSKALGLTKYGSDNPVSNSLHALADRVPTIPEGQTPETWGDATLSFGRHALNTIPEMAKASLASAGDWPAGTIHRGEMLTPLGGMAAFGALRGLPIGRAAHAAEETTVIPRPNEGLRPEVRDKGPWDADWDHWAWQDQHPSPYEELAKHQRIPRLTSHEINDIFSNIFKLSADPDASIPGTVVNALSENAPARPSGGIQVYHGTPIPPDSFGPIDLAKSAPHARRTAGGEMYFSEDRPFAADYVDRSSSGQKPPKDERGQGFILPAKLRAAPEEFLDLYKPLADQHPSIRDAAQSYLEKQVREGEFSPEVLGLDFSKLTGNSLLDLMKYGHTDPASALPGVHGISWATGNEGPRNYGVWNKEIIEPDRLGPGNTLPWHILDKFAPEVSPMRGALGARPIANANVPENVINALSEPTRRQVVPAVKIEGDELPGIYAAGPTHSHALDRWLNARRNAGLRSLSDADWDGPLLNNVEDGYVAASGPDKGRYLTREEAHAYVTGGKSGDYNYLEATRGAKAGHVVDDLYARTSSPLPGISVSQPDDDKADLLAQLGRYYSVIKPKP